ncbi:MAG: metalloregulator ArsR/SmtB family transcription factor [Candidatus Tritonobacter lacicola]|nr:metalloregulator ArsR/SmtB family transcription factor [Candidatus Tritonobacter lacicola]
MRKNDLDKESRVLKALANITRLAIVKELLKKEKCVSDIEHLLGARQANISQHLAILRWANIVDCCYDGKMHCYYLKDPKMMLHLLELLKKLKT